MRSDHYRPLFVTLLLGSLLLTPELRAQELAAPEALAVSQSLSLDQLAAAVASKRVVFIGETHNRYDHHLNQLELINRLHQADPQMVIGVEYFQQPFQQPVDDYIDGRIDETEFLRATEYFRRWGYDYRLYAPIFRYAREQRIPVRALNVPAELSSSVAKLGIAGISAERRAYLPKQIEPADEAYRNRLQKAFEAHGQAKPGDFEHFMEAQRVWDEGMAEAASTYLNSHPETKMVVLAGSGHVEFGSGIPKGVQRRTNATYAIVINNEDGIAAPNVGDYVLFSKKEDLPPAGILGVKLVDRKGKCIIDSVEPGGAAAKAGLKKGEVITEIDTRTIEKSSDTRLVLWNKKPGDRVQVSIRSGSATRELEIELAPPAKPKPQQ